MSQEKREAVRAKVALYASIYGGQSWVGCGVRGLKGGRGFLFVLFFQVFYSQGSSGCFFDGGGDKVQSKPAVAAA